MITVPIQTTKPYNVYIGKGLLAQAGSLMADRIAPCSAVLVSDSTVTPLYADEAASSLAAAGYEVTRYVFPAGEASKNWTILGSLLEFLAQSQLTRSDILVALGGGVTGDLTGFAASIYLRGIRYVQIPTTLLACVDSSVGGKTAVDLQAGKNLAGAFWQPQLVICDTDTLKTLSDHIFLDGVSESIKYGIIRDFQLFCDIESGGFDAHCDKIIAECISMKGDIVAEDEFDKGTRELLNYGHTLGHAVEKCSNFSISHGHAVAIGMNMAASIAARIGYCTSKCAHQIQQSLLKLGFSLDCPYSKEELLPVVLLDKKRKGDIIDFILPKEIGCCEIYPVKIKDLEEFL